MIISKSYHKKAGKFRHGMIIRKAFMEKVVAQSCSLDLNSHHVHKQEKYGREQRVL